MFCGDSIKKILNRVHNSDRSLAMNKKGLFSTNLIERKHIIYITKLCESYFAKFSDTRISGIRLKE